ncbi:MAG: serine hydrolase [SAR202 cluster bacterium]|nr:serine hydrolase [SAR202 cluster bacterium]
MLTVQEAIANVPGEVQFVAKHMESLQEFSGGASGIYPPASTFKVPILAELYRQVDDGIIDTQRRVELTDADRSPGSGVLKEMANGLRLSIHDLAMLMIIISDNTATDILYNLIGRERLNDTMRDLGLTETKLPMSCREMLYSMFGVSTNDISLGNAQVTTRLARQEILPNAAGFSEDLGNVSSPSDMMRLLEVIYTGGMHSSKSRDEMMNILDHQQQNTIIPADLPLGTIVAHKTGGVPSVRCDVGIVFSPSGPYIGSIMSKHVTDMKVIDRRLAAVSRAVYDHFNP